MNDSLSWAARFLSLVRIAAGLLFFQHGAEKIWGFAGGRIEHSFTTMRGFAGPLEVAGATLLILGLFTRTTAFILCGEMAVAYFTRWAPRGFWPISNGGEEAVIFCYMFLWFVAAGAGPWSLDQLLEARRRGSGALKASLIRCEPYARSVMRILLSYVFLLHGFRHLFGYFVVSGGRRAAVPMALDGLPAAFGYVELLGGALLLVGYFTRPVALIASLELLVAYVFVAAPRSPWPIRNGGNEVLEYLLAFLYLAIAGAGAWSVDRWFTRGRTEPLASAVANKPS